MGSVNTRSGRLYLDFKFRGVRCREQTQLADTSINRKKLAKVMTLIEQQISSGLFDYAHHFPNSKKVAHFQQLDKLIKQKAIGGTILFEPFAEQWVVEKKVEWRPSHIETTNGILNCHLLPRFGKQQIGSITKADIMAFRAQLCQPEQFNGKTLSASRINHIMTTLRMIINEAAERFDYETPWRNIKPLPLPRTEIKPFTLDQVQLILRSVRADFAPYYAVRFFTGMRTGEIDGLIWDNVDFGARVIHIHQALVRGEVSETKTSGSYRSIAMSQPVYDALYKQWQVTGEKSTFVFCSHNGQPLNYRNVTRRVWYPLLEELRLDKRNAYQTRHTAATLWLAAGESPEWIARQLGHANTSMLFKVYSRYIPNLVGRDGDAFEALFESAS